MMLILIQEKRGTAYLVRSRYIDKVCYYRWKYATLDISKIFE